MRKRLETALKAMPNVKIDADSTEAELAIAGIRKDLETLRDAKIGVHLSEAEFFVEVARIREQVRSLERDGATIEIRANSRVVGGELDVLAKTAADDAAARVAGAKSGNEYGGAFVDAVRRRLDAGIKALSSVPVTVDSSNAERDIARLREDLATLRDVRIGVDLTEQEFFAELAKVEAALRTLSESNVEIEVKTNARQALAELEALRAAVAAPMSAGGAADPSGKGAKDGEAYGGAFGSRAREAIDAALKSIGKIELDADSTPAERRIEEIRVRLQALRDLKIGVDIDAGAAEAELTLLRFQLQELSRDNVNVDVQVNAARAAAELEAFQLLIDKIDRDNINVKVDADTSGATSGLASLGDQAGVSLGRLGTLIAVGSLLGTALVPAAAAAAVAISSIAFAASAALAGVGVFALGIMGVVKAITALNAEQKKAATAQAPVSHQQDQIASALDGVATAQQGLERAERSRTQAIADLTKAQETARRSLEDMTFSVKSNALAQRQANLDVADAKKALDLVMANPRATAAEREQAQITYQEKLLQIQQLGVEGKRLADDKAAADKKGVQGSDAVTAAQQKIADATESVAAAQRQVAASNRALATAYKGTQVAGTAAMNNLKTAMDELSPAGRRFALFIFGLKSQFLDLRHAAEEGFLPGLQEAITMLLPYEPALKNFISNVARALGDTFVYFAKALQNPVFKQFFGYLAATAAPALKGMAEFSINVMQGLAGILLGLTGFNAPIGEGLLKWSEGFAKWSETLSTNTGWQKFLSYVRQAAPKVVDLLHAMWDFVVLFVKAAAPIGIVVVEALTQLFRWLEKLDAKTWSGIIVGIAGLAGALLVLEAATAILTAGPVALTILALVAVGTGLYILYQKVAGFRSVVDTTFKYIVTAVKIWADILVWSWKNVYIPVFEGIGIVAVWLWKNILKPTFEFIGAAIVVWANVLLWSWQNVFIPTFHGIGAVAVWLWTNILKPTFEFIAAAIGVVGAVVMWLWNNVWAPTFSAIGAIAGWLWTNIIKPNFDFIAAAVGVLGSIFMWLWHNVFEPLWQAVEIGWKIVWAVLQVVFGLIEIAFKIFFLSLQVIWDIFLKPMFQAIVWFVQTVLAPIFTWLWKTIIKPAFEGIYAAVKWVWDNWLKPVFSAVGDFIKNEVVPAFKQGLKGLSDAWGGLVEAAKIPVRFIVNTILNDGLLAAYNWVAHTFGVKPDNVHITLPKGFAGGGLVLGAGGPRDDAILARLSNGEYVIPADIVRRYGIEFFDQITGRLGVPAGNDQPGDGSQGLVLPGFAAGGLVSDVWGALKTGWNTISDPMKYIRDKVAGLLDNIPGFGWIKDDLIGAEKKTINDVVTWLTGKITNQVSTGYGRLLSPQYVGPISADVAAVQAWIQSQAGKPYVWAAAGPGGYDCCLIQTTRVDGPDGAKQIKDVRAGDLVYSFVDGKVETHTVTAAWQSIHQPVFAVRTQDRTVTASANHPFLRVVETDWLVERQWVRLDELRAGDLVVQLAGGRFTLTSVLAVTPMGDQDTWDLEVEEAHNFVADGVVVHNSGMQSAAWNMLHGRNPYQHTFSTSNEAAYFPLAGHGLYTVGYAGPGELGGGRVGHTAGNLAGLPFVSRGGDGVVVGPRTESVDSFAHVAHFDSGGLIQPGWTAMLNNTGRPEPVLTTSQWRDINVLARQGDSQPGNTYQFAFKDTTLDPGQLRALQDRESALSRQGRAR